MHLVRTRGGAHDFRFGWPYKPTLLMMWPKDDTLQLE